jgi:hypothetical protein
VEITLTLKTWFLDETRFLKTKNISIFCISSNLSFLFISVINVNYFFNSAVKISGVSVLEGRKKPKTLEIEDPRGS